MAQQSRKINVSELDFDKIKSNLKEFLRGQAEFSDYDFEGSALSVLIDVLAYNTHYNALYTNFALNEMFLDSASKRNSVVSIANMLGYTPISSTAATAKVNLKFTNLTNPPATYTIDAYQPFTTSINGTSYNFYTTGSATATLVSSPSFSYTFQNLEIKEGTLLNYSFTYGSDSRYIIPNKNVDITTLKVSVQYSGTGTSTIFSKADSISGLDSSSAVYFIKEIDNELYEISFGDGVFGAQLNNGDVIKITYFTSNRSNANNAKTFVYNGSKPSGATATVTTVSASYGGSEIETLDSVKYNAPKAFSAQDRAVTSKDYKNLIIKTFQYIDSVSVWGGEVNNPPVYGKVFVSAKPEGALFLTTSQKSDIENYIRTKNVSSIIPVLVDPEYLDIVLDTTVYYDPSKTNLSNSAIVTSISNTITNYNDTDLSKFDAIFRHSKLSRLIDTCNDSILSNITKPTLRKYVFPAFGSSYSYSFSLVNPIYTTGIPAQAFSSSGFYISNSEKIHYLTDDGLGNVQLYYTIQVNGIDTRVIVNPYAGTIKYTNGTININSLTITSLVSGNELIFYIKPQSYDIVSAFNQVIKINMADSTINAIPDSTTGNQALSTNYIFTSSRS